MSLLDKENIFAGIPASFQDEIFQTIVELPSFKFERILSNGQATPPGEWYDQEWDEWVVLLTGSAGLRFADDSILGMEPGDCINIPAHVKHRVEWTDARTKTVWLALHYKK